MKYRKDGNDYVLDVYKEIKITISKEYSIWSVWVNDVKVRNFIDRLSDAKEEGMKIARAIKGDI